MHLSDELKEICVLLNINLGRLQEIIEGINNIRDTINIFNLYLMMQQIRRHEDAFDNFLEEDLNRKVYNLIRDKTTSMPPKSDTSSLRPPTTFGPPSSNSFAFPEPKTTYDQL